MTLPTFQAVGTAAHGTGGVSPAWPTHTTGDLGILLCESVGTEAVSAPAGWTACPCSPISSGAATRISAFWRIATSSAEGAPSVADPGDHVHTVIATFRGTDQTNPFAAAASSFDATATSTAIAAGTNTRTVSDCIVACIYSWSTDNAGPASSGETNATLGSLTERYDEGTTDGNGGGLVLITGTLATAGNTDNTTITLSPGGTTTYATLTLAIQPPQSSGSGLVPPSIGPYFIR
jgi:hypothetical protein